MNKKKSVSKNNVQLQDLLNLMTGYQRSRVLFTLVELEIPQILNDKPLTTLTLAKQKEIHPLAMQRFLDASVSIGLLTKTKNRYANSELTKSFLIKGTDNYLGGQIERHRKRSYKVWSKLTNQLRTWEYGNVEKSNPEDEDQGAKAMVEQHNFALLQGSALANTFDFSKYKKILDLGGGTGATSIALCQKYPKLKSIVFDLQENTKIAQKFVRKANLDKQIKVVSGDFKKDELPDDFDAVLLANFMSVAEAKENKSLLKKLYKKLPKNGVCILSGWMIDDSHLAPQISVLFCLEDICWDAPDVERSEKIYAEWLKKAGFKKIICETYLEPTKMLYGYKKA